MKSQWYGQATRSIRGEVTSQNFPFTRDAQIVLYSLDTLFQMVASLLVLVFEYYLGATWVPPLPVSASLCRVYLVYVHVCAGMQACVCSERPEEEIKGPALSFSTILLWDSRSRIVLSLPATALGLWACIYSHRASYLAVGSKNQPSCLHSQCFFTHWAVSLFSLVLGSLCFFSSLWRENLESPFSLRLHCVGDYPSWDPSCLLFHLDHSVFLDDSPDPWLRICSLLKSFSSTAARRES